MADIVTAVCCDTTLVVILNGAEVALPAATVTVGGTAATAGSELASETVTPPAGAGPLKLTEFPARVFPPITPFWSRLTEATPKGVTVRVTGTVIPL